MYKLTRFQSFSITNGLRPNKSNFNIDLVQSQNSYNITAGIQAGQSPRYGMAPIPGHSNTDATNSAPVGLMQSESNTGTNRFKNRNRILGVIPVTLGTFSDISQKRVHYVWIVADTNNRINFVFGGTFSGGKYQHVNDIAAGIQPAVQDIYSAPLSHLDPLVQHFPLRDSTSLSDLNNFLSIPSSMFSCSVTSLTVSGKDVSMQWVAGRAMTEGDLNTTALPNFTKPDSAVSSNHFMGLPSFFNTRNFKDSVRQMTFFNIDDNDSLIRQYNYQISPQASTFVATFDQNNTTPNITSAIGAGTGVDRLDGASPTYADVETVLYNDSQSTVNSGYTAIAAAPGKAVMALVQDWQRNHDGTLMQYIDPTNPVFTPITRQTLAEGAASNYTENAIEKATCWAVWPDYTDATPLAKDSAAARDGVAHVTLGAADSGVLRSNTTYEIAFSIYDKQINYESNVGQPAKFLTDSDDFVRLSLFRDGQTTAQYNQKNAFGYALNIPFPLSFNADGSPNNTPINYLEYRVYYRELGSFEWLPALQIDAAKYWYYPSHLELWACEGAIASLPGGQPGAFNDYSPLPKDVYNDVKVFQGRMFWLSAQSLNFSDRNNVFSYPLRNSVTCPIGEFRGMIIHYFFGETLQTGNIVVFGSKETYVGTFTGNKISQPIQVSPETVATFELDGSDFQLSAKTTVTAFSSKSAIVAEGELYFWGPTGVYFDNGISIPEKISVDLEPDIFSIYDPNKIDDITCQYLEETKEIVWFFQKKNSTTGKSSGLVYNTISEQFFFMEFDSKIDWSSKVSIDRSSVDRGTNGTRSLIGLRENAAASIQRSVFFDYRNRAGDFAPGHEFMVKQVSEPVDGTLRFYLAGGYNQTAYNNITIGSKLCLQQGTDYSAQATIADIFTQISAKGGTYPNNYIEVVRPLELDSYFTGTLTPDRYFPIYESLNNGISYIWETNFWVADGVKNFYRFLFAHLLFKLNLLPSSNKIPPNQGLQTIDFSYKTPISKEYVENTLTLSENSAGNFQVYTQLKQLNQAAEGQGLRLKLSGVHLGTEWVLQYVGVDSTLLDGDNLQHFEG